ncbi:MAG: flavin reductase family protein [Luteibaculaceae bacterium]
MIYTQAELLNLEKRYRTNLINCLPNLKPVVLIGTSQNNQHNLAPFNSVVHIGANPPLLGFIQRPAEVERHTYENIISQQYYTINVLSAEHIEAVHQCSARYPKETSEFTATGLTPEFMEHFDAPFVQEAVIKIGLKFAEEHHITANNTKLIVGEIKLLNLPDHLLLPDGFIDLSKANIFAANGLDGYSTINKPTRLSYAKPDKKPQII